MSIRRIISLALVVCICHALSATGIGQDASGARPRLVKPTPTPKGVAKAPATPPGSTTPAQPTPVSAVDLISQGKVHYRAGRYKPALAKFDAALKAEPDNDEALGLAAITAFRLDSQEQARNWFMRRANLEGQKPSVKGFSYYRIALTYWRQVHDEVAKSGAIVKGQTEYKMPEDKGGQVREMIRSGLDYAERALTINPNYAEALNVKNLLQTEAAFASSDPAQAGRMRDAAAESLRKAIKLQRQMPAPPEAEPANFNQPTVRVGEFPRTLDEETTVVDDMMKRLEGGRPIKRTSPVFPSTKPSKGNEPSSTGVTDKGGAYSIGGGRGALTAAYAPGTVKVEVLISPQGDVVFVHVVDGRDDLNGSAILAARGWKFSAPRFEGSPVQVSGLITFDMKPAGSRATPTPTPRATKP